MARKMLINVSDAEEARVAIVDDGLLEDFDIETTGRERNRGNIYKGIVARVAPALQAAFVEYQEGRVGFLPLKEVCYRHVDPRYKDREAAPRNRPSISQLLRPRQEVLVQVVKEETGNKGASLTTFYSLAGRYLVLMPGSDSTGVSRRIDDEEGRKKLKAILADLRPPEGYGLIARTAGYKAKKPELQRDFNYLMRLWEDILQAAERTPLKSLIYQERDIAIRAIRDYFTSDILEVLVDDPDVYRRAQNFMRLNMPSKQKIVKLYSGPRPIFNKHQLEEQIERIYKRVVPLKSGGEIVIDPTEAFVAVDVNSGKSTSEANLEETAYRTDIEAAEEIARQLRLRDLGGIIVIDFIDLNSRAHIRDLEKTITAALKKDRARTELSRMGKFGLVAISRQRLGPRVDSAVYETCVACGGEGVVRSVESRAMMTLRKIQGVVAGRDVTRLTVGLPTDVMMHIINNKREVLTKLEQSGGIRVRFERRDDLKPNEETLEVARGPQAAPPASPHAEVGGVTETRSWVERGTAGESEAFSAEPDAFSTGPDAPIELPPPDMDDVPVGPTPAEPTKGEPPKAEPAPQGQRRDKDGRWRGRSRRPRSRGRGGRGRGGSPAQGGQGGQAGRPPGEQPRAAPPAPEREHKAAPEEGSRIGPGSGEERLEPRTTAPPSEPDGDRFGPLPPHGFAGGRFEWPEAN